ncbi:MAG: nicotinate-nucleotide pyrophosphorylase (carboxylating) [Kiritimatiellia bacterium]|jgi:nicotinate-nucleotide pyrophosphorylase (carboxylating)
MAKGKGRTLRKRNEMDFSGIAHHPDVVRLIDLALEEDLSDVGDVTTQAIVNADQPDEGWIVAREDMVLAGLPVAEAVFVRVSKKLKVTGLAADGDDVVAGTRIMHIQGPAAAILTGERLALNFLQRLCGVATITRRFVDQVVEGVQVLDTRKTTPGFRMLEKYAVKCGGGTNHRIGLYDQVLIKDNHLDHWVTEGQKTLAAAVRVAREKFPELMIEVETDTLDQVRQVLEAKPDWILLDNMSNDDLRQAVALCKGVCFTEASGGVNLATIAAISETGVDAISVGALTHSSPAMDLAMDF